MSNVLSPSWINIRYTSNGHRHTMTLPVTVDGVPTPGSTIDLERRAATADDWKVCVDEFLALLAPSFKTTDSFTLAELWYQPTPEAAPQFINAYNPDVDGTSTDPDITAAEAVLTFRTATRGGLKLYLLETHHSVNFKALYPTGNSQIDPIFAYVLGINNFITGRNNEFPLAGISYTTKINDVLRDKYLLGN